MNLSVIICCYNSENRIVPTLDYLAKQTLGTLSCEIILVDNNCSDSTVETALKAWNSFGSPNELRIIKEIQPGQSFARKSGVLEAKGEIIVFCDDDNWLCENYLLNVFNLFKENSNIGILGGWSEPVFEIEKPKWFDEVCTSFACGGFTEERLIETSFVWGAGMALKNELSIAIFKTNLTNKGRAGRILTSGDDSEICERARILGFSIYKSNLLFFRHFMSKDRLTIDYLGRLYVGFGYSSAEKSFISYGKPTKYILIQILRTIVFLSKNTVPLVNFVFDKGNVVSILGYYVLKGNWIFLRKKYILSIFNLWGKYSIYDKN